MRRLTRQVVSRLTRRVTLEVQQQDVVLRALVDANFRTRAMLKQATHQPIHLVFVCHSIALWSMFDSIYQAAVTDPAFQVTVVALPYRHPTLPDGEYKDDGVHEFLHGKGITVIRGYNRERDEWISPATLSPDYVFFQQPYDLFPRSWSVARISPMARVCYLTYAPTLSTGELGEVVQPEGFFRYSSIFFMESQFKRELFYQKFGSRPWFEEDKVVTSGYPKFDYLQKQQEFSSGVWKRGYRPDIRRVLWTPRWRTTEGTCHFFDYKDFFSQFCLEHQGVDFVFRPHPLCFQNFAKTGEFSVVQSEKLRSDYDASPNMTIDSSAAYEDTFMTSDILVSDFSSMMIEYLATGKPIIYTHRTNIFNEYGQKLSDGLYWVMNAKELRETLEMLLSGHDPLRGRRREVMQELIFMPEGGSGLTIKNHLHQDFHNR